MPIVTIIIIALGLAMDAFAVSIVSGATFKKLKVHHALRMAGFFGDSRPLCHWSVFWRA